MAYLLVHISGPSHNGGIKQPRQSIKLGSLNARRPEARVFVTKEDMAFIKLDGPNEWTLAEIGSGESELGVAGAASGGISGAGEKAVVLETAGVRGGFGEVTVEMVRVGDWGRRR